MSRSIASLLSKLNVPFVEAGQHHHATKGWLNIDCPYCSPGSGKYRLGINLAGRYTACWTCGAQSLANVLASVAGLTQGESRALLAGIRSSGPPERARKRGKLVLPKGIGPLLRCHKDYLNERGFNPDEVVRLWGVGGIGLAGKYSWRIFLPALSGSEVVSWTTRSISDTARMRYVSAGHDQEALPLKEILYGEHYCRHCVVVNEGPLDAWAVGPGAVATCGVSYTRRQLLLLSRYPIRVILFDAEPDAQRRASKLADDLSVFPGSTFNVVLESGKDASRASKKELRKLRRTFLE